MTQLAIVGLGWWGQKIVRDLQDSEFVHVALGVEPNKTLADDLASQLPFEIVTSLEDALARDDIDAVALCSPHRFHAAQIEAVAAAKKHVFCEKPLAVNFEEAQHAAHAVTASGVLLGVGHERRFEAPVRRMYEAVEAGELGTPLVFEANFSQDKFLALEPDNWRLSPTEAPVGPLSATGIHLVDLAVSLFGDASRVWAQLGQHSPHFRNGDTLTVSIEFVSGGSALLTAVLATPFIGRMALLGTEGWIEIRDRAHPENSEGWLMTETYRAPGKTTERSYPPHHPVRDNIEAFAKAADGNGSYPIPVAEMLATCAVFEAIVESAQTGEIVTVKTARTGT